MRLICYNQLWCHLALLLVTLISLSCLIRAADSAAAMADTLPARLDACAVDENISSVCFACSQLPFVDGEPSTSCCTDTKAFTFCEACIGDQESCYKVIQEIQEVQQFEEAEKSNTDEYLDGDTLDEMDVENPEFDKFGTELFPEIPQFDNTERQKRFGTLFMKSPKRYGRYWFGKRASDSLDKRFGRLFVGSSSYPGKRAGDLENASPDDQNVDKRYGRLYMGSGSYFGKRDDMLDSEDGGSMDKRFGRLYMGSGSYFGKRSGDDMSKRFGTLHMGGTGYFGKRSADLGGGVGVQEGDAWEDNMADGQLSRDDIHKRYGTLFTGKGGWFGKRSDSETDSGNIDKRFGRLFIGKGNKYFGKRSNTVDVSDVSKRFGRLFMGG